VPGTSGTVAACVTSAARGPVEQRRAGVGHALSRWCWSGSGGGPKWSSSRGSQSIHRTGEGVRLNPLNPLNPLDEGDARQFSQFSQFSGFTLPTVERLDRIGQ